MNTETFTDNMSTIHDGKIVIPGEIQKYLGVSEGSRVMFILDGEEVQIVNPAVRSFKELQEGMKGAAEEAGWTSDDDVVEYIMEMRRKSR